jgi:hypothetical protein
MVISGIKIKEPHPLCTLLISPWLKEDARKSEERLITPLINN